MTTRRHRPRTLRPAVILTLLLAVAACGRDEKAADGDAGAASASANATAANAGAANAAVALTDADLDAWERGMTKEVELVQAAQQRAATATTPQARGEAMQAQWKEQTMPGGAESAGLPLARYRDVRETVNGVLETLDFQGKIAGPLSMDTTHATPEMRQRLASDPYAALPPASAAALRARLDRIVPLWSKYMSLVAVAG